MAASTDEERIRSFKLKGVENYRPWAIYMQATFESKVTWEIVDGTRAKSTTLDNKSDQVSKGAFSSTYNKYF